MKEIFGFVMCVSWFVEGALESGNLQQGKVTGLKYYVDFRSPCQQLSEEQTCSPRLFHFSILGSWPGPWEEQWSSNSPGDDTI